MVTLGEVNSGIVSKFTGFFAGGTVLKAIGWGILGLLVVGFILWYWWYRVEKKKYNRKITAHGIIHGYFHPTYRDVAKTVKLGKGGFELLYLKKLKTWKLAHGARTGMNEYDFYILSDGYWFPGQISSDMKQIDDNGGFISVITTNPLMRAQYTALEKQIDALHGDKKGFWDKYGQWVLTGVYIAIIGIFCWLSFREIADFLGSGSALADRMNELAETMNRLAINLNNANQPSGLVPAP